MSKKDFIPLIIEAIYLGQEEITTKGDSLIIENTLNDILS